MHRCVENIPKRFETTHTFGAVAESVHVDPGLGRFWNEHRNLSGSEVNVRYSRFTVSRKTTVIIVKPYVFIFLLFFSMHFYATKY